MSCHHTTLRREAVSGQGWEDLGDRRCDLDVKVVGPFRPSAEA